MMVSTDHHKMPRAVSMGRDDRDEDDKMTKMAVAVAETEGTRVEGDGDEEHRKGAQETLRTSLGS